MDRFSNQVVVVTGGGSGIGAATAARFVREGARVVLAGRTEDKLKAQARLSAAGGLSAGAPRTSACRPMSTL